jgi:hypothetical protein
VNVYVYTESNPIRWSDLRGLVVGVDDAVVIIGAAALTAATTAYLQSPAGKAAVDSVYSGVSQAAGLFDPVTAYQGAVEMGRDAYSYFAKKVKRGSKPKDCPTGTKPIDKYPGLSREDRHKIKHRVQAGPDDWTGITPDGRVITGNGSGNAVDNGPFSDYLP